MRFDPDENREPLIGQVRHLVDEIDALEEQVRSVPDDVLSTSPLEHEPSIKELYALIGLYDGGVYLPALRAMTSNDRPRLSEGEDADLLEGCAWDEEPFPAVLNFVREARMELIEFVSALPNEAWNRRAIVGERSVTLFEVVHAIVHHDAQILRAAARRMHDSRWSP